MRRFANGHCAALLLPAAALAAPDVSATLDQYCTRCHNPEDWAGGLDLTSLDPVHVGGDAASWEKVVRKLRAGMMPPPGKERPSRADAAEGGHHAGSSAWTRSRFLPQRRRRCTG